MRTNYHAHTWRCRHARGTEEEMVQRAIEQGFAEFGFSDHSPWPYPGGFISNYQMLPEQLDDYVRTVRRLREKYRGKIRLHLGLEAEYFPSMMGWMKETVDHYGLYLIMGDHFENNPGFYFGSCTTRGEMNRYLDRVTEGLATGLYTYLAHPDLFLNSFPGFTKDCEDVSRELCRACKAMNIPLEYNLLGESRQEGSRRAGKLGYTTPEFWRVAAQEGVSCIVGVDCHTPEALDAGQFDRAQAYLRSLGLEPLDGQELPAFTF